VVFRDAGFQVPRHPTQIYELLLDLLIFAFLLWWDRKKKFSGEILILMFSLYSFARLIVEFFRWSPPYILGLSYAQYFSIAFIGVCFYWLYLGRKKGTLHVLAGETKLEKGRR
jgi:phosphatidylglycerol:prolipoprotein diacylglycerol transferase